jgi:hypothetical protein
MQILDKKKKSLKLKEKDLKKLEHEMDENLKKHVAEKEEKMKK